jgi:hypothetical protein
MRIAKRTLLTLLLGVALAVTAAAQGSKPNIGRVQIIIKDIATKEDIATVSPGETITLPPGARVRLIMSALPTGTAHGPLYPATTFSETTRGGVVITRSNVENAAADLQVNRLKGGSRTETIRYQISETWVPEHLRTGSFHIRVEPDTDAGAEVVGGTRAEQLTRVLYRGILLREPDTGARGTIDSIARGGFDALVTAAVGIANSEESRYRLAATPEQRLTALYKELLGLSPTQADAQQWRSDLDRVSQGRIAEVVSAMVQSQLFRERHDLVGVRY